MKAPGKGRCGAREAWKIALWMPLTIASASAADFVHFTPTPLKAPDCITNAAPSFFTQNEVLPEPPHPTLPIGRYYQIVRFLGDGSVAIPTDFDFGHFPAGHPSGFQGWPLTGLTTPAPRGDWQRASRADATLDNSSAFQLSCYDAGSFINTWTFAWPELIGAGPHAIYGYSFDNDATPPLFDGDPGTDFVLQAAVEIPWFAAWPAAGLPAGSGPLGQVCLFAYFRDRSSGRTFALILALFDSRYPPDSSYPSLVMHDGATPFASMPMATGGRYAHLSPVSSTFGGAIWSGLRFFRAHVTQDDFRAMLADVNSYCQANPALRYCDAPPHASAFSASITQYEVTDFGVIHEVFDAGPHGNMSMGVHVYALGAWNFR
jgi:hypothetical protein